MAVAMQVCTVDHSMKAASALVACIAAPFTRKISCSWFPPRASPYNAQIRKVYTFENLSRLRSPEAHAGDIVAVIGIEAADIGDVITDRENPVEMKPIAVEEPTMAVVFKLPRAPSWVVRVTSLAPASKERLMREKGIQHFHAH